MPNCTCNRNNQNTVTAEMQTIIKSFFFPLHRLRLELQVEELQRLSVTSVIEIARESYVILEGSR